MQSAHRETEQPLVLRLTQGGETVSHCCCHTKHVETSKAAAAAWRSSSTARLLRLFSKESEHTPQVLFWVELFFCKASSFPGSFKIGLLFYVHDLPRINGQSQPREKGHTNNTTPAGTAPEIRHTSAGEKQP